MNRKEEYQDDRWKARAAEIRELDHHQCVLCGATGVELQVHHLSYPPPPFHIWEATDNELVTLCKDCHRQVHQSKMRPYITKKRQLLGINIGTDHAYDCEHCKFHMQYDLLDVGELISIENDGHCKMLGGKDCTFTPVVTCEKCNFRQCCERSIDSLACAKYDDIRYCSRCKYYSEQYKGDGEYEGFCSYTYQIVDCADDCYACNKEGFEINTKLSFFCHFLKEREITPNEYKSQQAE